MELTKMPNIGKVTAGQLVEAGVDTPDKLRYMGAKEAFLRIRAQSDPTACVRVLYGLEGAVRGVKDTELPEAVKKDLLAYFKSL